MLKSVSAIAALLLAVAILYAGNGLQATLLSLRANIEEFPTGLIGLIMAGYYVGFIAGCQRVPHIIRAVGHIRTFLALASIASASTLLHILVVDPYAWAILRIISGFCFAGIAMVLEIWINDRATNENRGQILSVYRIVDLGALTLGNALLTVANPAGFQLFVLVSILLSIALVPVALTRTVAPSPPASAKLEIRKLFRLSPVAAVGAFVIGLANAAFWTLAPIFVQRIGYNADAVAFFMSVVIIGAAVFQWPLGWVSDRIDRRIVLVGGSIAGALAAFSLSAFGDVSQLFLGTIGFVFGGFIIPMFGLAIAHANDHVPEGGRVSVNGGLLLLHGCGAVAGTLLGAQVISLFGPPSLFLYIGALYLIVAGFTLFRIMQRGSVPKSAKEKFSPIPRNPSQAIFEIQQVEPTEEDRKDGA